MDPFSAILLIGMFTVATVKTAGTAATDGLAQAKGQTPPSQERWRAKENKKRQRGEQPRDDPGGLKRIWQQHTEAAAEKSAAKHDGKMRYLRKHGDAIAEGKRKQLERAARRREYLGGTLARAGGSSWDALKTAAQKAADAKRAHDDRKAEEQAWRENSWRDEEEAHNRNNHRRQDEPSATGVDQPENTADGQGGADRADADVPSSQDEAPDADVLSFPQRATTGEDTAQTGSKPAAQKGGDTTGTDPERDLLTNPETGRPITRGELHRRRALHDDDRRRAEADAQRTHEADQAQAEREHRERLAQIQQPSTSTTDTSEGDAMSTPQSGTTEITSLETAQLRANESAQYAATVQSVIADQVSAMQAALQGMQAEAAAQEQASASLGSNGFDSGITGRFDRGQESFNNAVAALQAQIQQMQAAQEDVTAAQQEMQSASQFFTQQQGIAESIAANSQGGGKASSTSFYTGSSA